MYMLLDLRTAAQNCYDADLRTRLRGCADDLAIAIKVFGAASTTDNLVAVNGLWAQGDRLLKAYKNLPDDTSGGHMPVPAQSEVLELKAA